MNTLEQKRFSEIEEKFKRILNEHLKILLDDEISINLELITKEDVKDTSERELVKFLNKEVKELNNDQLNDVDSKFRKFRYQENKLDTSSVEYLNFFTIKKSKESIVCYLSIQGLEENTIEIFEQFEGFSFLKFVLDKFFEECRYINGTSCDFCEDIVHNEKDYLRSLTRDFIQEITNPTDNGFINLFDQLNYISALNYEGQSVSAKLILMNKDKHLDNVKFYIHFNEKIEFSEHRKIRKILETSGENVYLIGDNANIYGLGTLKNMSKIKNEKFPILVIDFYDRFEYKIKSAFIESETITVEDNKPYEQINAQMKERNLLNVVYGQPNLREGEFSEQNLENKLQKVFGDDEDKDKLLKIISYAKEQKHGTTVVITTSEMAESEIEKLKNQSTKIKKKALIENEEHLSKKMIKSITSIDGAIIIDTKGVCYGMGVILDGLAVEEGKSARGARYNSAIRYVNKGDLKGKCLVVVISEDGMIDIIYEDGSKKEKKINDLINEAKQLYEDEKYDDALKKIEEALELDKKNAKLYNTKGGIYKKIGKNGHAINNFTKAIKLKPDYAVAYNNRGIAYRRNEEYEKAIEDYSKAIELKPDYAKAYYNRGNAYDDNQEYDKAIEDYSKAIELNQKYVLSFKNLNITYKKLIKLYPEKREELSKKIRQNEEIIKNLENDEEIK